MKTGSFTDNRFLNRAKYSYFRSGTKVPYLPDCIKEEVDMDFYTSENGNLFYGKEVSWRDNILLQHSIDIWFELEDKSFIDHILIRQGYGSAIGSVEIFTFVDGEYKKIGTYTPETGKLIESEELTVKVGYYCENVIVRLNGDCMPVAIKKLDIWGAWDFENSVYPTPKKTDYSGNTILLSAIKTIKASGEDLIFAANYLAEKFEDKTGHKLEVSENEGDIVLNIADVAEKDSYIIDTTSNTITITAPDRLCLLYGADALVQLADNDCIKGCRIEDEAFMEFRGIHIAIPSKNQVDFLKSIVKYVFVPMRYNTIYLQIAAAMRYDKYPEINKAWLEANEMYEKGEWPIPAHYGFVSRDIWEKPEVRELCDYFESFGLEVVPEIQSYGHAQYVTMAYPELAEKAPVEDVGDNTDLVSKDKRPDTFYYHTLCPLHRDYYKVMFNIIDEVLEVVKPKRFVHMGHDEIYEVGKCPECKKVPRGDLLANEINTLNDYIKSKNLTMIIWSDMFHDMSYSAMPAINKVSKDVIMMDFVWYFHLDKDLEDNLLSHGFKVMMGNMNSSHYPRFESRSHKEGMIGAEVSIWLPCDEIIYAFNGKVYEFVYAAEGMWNSNYDSTMRLSYNEMIKPIINRALTNIGKLKCDGVEKSLNICGDRKNIPYDIRDIIPYDGALKVNMTNSKCEIALNESTDIITFVHATNKNGKKVMWAKPPKIGEYVIVYEDGSTYTEDIIYCANIYKYLSVYGDRIKSALFRHQGYVGAYLAEPLCGKTYNGEDYTLGKYSIRNPFPEKKIKSIKINHSKDTDTEILLFGVSMKKRL